MLHLPDIIGQGHSIGRLQRTLTSNRQPHAYLFAGPEGVGRETTAIALAAALLCENPQTGPNHGRLDAVPDNQPVHLACQSCESCRLMQAGTHPDFAVVYKELARYHEDASVRNRVMQDLGIDVIRDFLIAPVGRASTRKHGKVFVVRESELMSVPAQNALLKTLEEPPAGVTLILLAQRDEQLLPTTRSRCGLVRFSPLPAAFVTDRLNQEGVDAQQAAFWARQTAGSIGTALRFVQAGLYDIKTDIVRRLAMLGTTGDAKLGEDLAKAVDHLADAIVAAVKAAEKADMSKNLATRQATGWMLAILSTLYRDGLTLATGADRPLVHADQADAVARIAQRFTPTDLAEIIEQLSEYERFIWRNVNPKTVWDNVIITCASAAPLRV